MKIASIATSNRLPCLRNIDLHLPTSRADYTTFGAYGTASIIARCFPRGSSSTLTVSSKIIVGRVSRLNVGHFGTFALFGSPVRANAMYVSLTASAIACARFCSSSEPPTIPGATATLSNANGRSIVCGALYLPCAAGDPQSIWYTHVRFALTGFSARFSAATCSVLHTRVSVVIWKYTSVGVYIGYHSRYFATICSGS